VRLSVLLLVALPALAQEQDAQRALMMRDRQSEQLDLENLAARQLLNVARDLPPALCKS
jgi:hypothetical protein